MPRNKKDKIGSVKADPLYSSDDFRMYCFKVMPCSRHYTHDWTECPFAHPGEKATRRDPRLYSYVGIECPHVKGESSKCPRGDMCPFAHNVFECWLHPSRYRTQMCNEPATCKRKICFFAHSMQEMREPTPVSKDMDIGLKQGPRRVTTSPDTRTTSQSPRMPLEATQEQELKKASVKARASFDVARKQPPVDIAPRASLDSTASRLGFQASAASQKLSLAQQQHQQQQNPQLLPLLALLQQQEQQQQMQMMKSDSFDLAAALAQLSIMGNTQQQQPPPQQQQHQQQQHHPQQQQQPCMQQGSYVPSQLTAAANGQSDQLNEALTWYLRQQALSNATNFALSHQQPVFSMNSPAVQMNCPDLSMSNAMLLQQLQHIQNLQGLSTAAGLRTSMDSTLSNGSGKIPTRVSFDGVSTSTAPAFNQPGLNQFNMGPLNQTWLGGIGTPDRTADYLFSANGTRSSSDSSAAESFGGFSGDAISLEAFKTKQQQSLQQQQQQQSQPPHHQEKSGEVVAQPGMTDDFIGLDQGVESFTRANVMSSSTTPDLRQI